MAIGIEAEMRILGYRGGKTLRVHCCRTMAHNSTRTEVCILRRRIEKGRRRGRPRWKSELDVLRLQGQFSVMVSRRLFRQKEGQEREICKSRQCTETGTGRTEGRAFVVSRPDEGGT